ncbi:hypothetical protein JZO70_04395 [Enterococcus sp. 669A]|uniref:Alternate signal-mediated exported protein n=1 Tax=Candidatus Enterococcus moelleringii TaxID=2815325 RepID=A0ABS3L8F9_9ENTE|nr:BsaA family SipW-dependent biofilm matrix protein [Enterococcus sp. 669A]MBO1305385.1 hypothetical protein [Enterococcus sp. 669A]
MSQKEKRRHLLQVFLKSKVLFACFSVVLSLLLIVGSTYAWITSADERINQTETSRKKLSARIDEDFNRVFAWAPGTTQTKKVRVRNDGEIPALIRLKLEETFVSFEVDTTDNHRQDAAPENNVNGNANLKTYGTPSIPAIDVKQTDTWAVGNTYEVSTDKHYKANYALPTQTYLYGSTRDTKPLSDIVLNFTQDKVFDDITQIEEKSNYWFYEDGYFYYSEVIDPGEQTAELLASVTLKADYNNQYKGALYKLVPEMDAHDISKSFLTDWGILNSDAKKVYENNDRLPYVKTINEGGAGR